MSPLPAGTDNKAIHDLLSEIKDLNKTIKKANLVSTRFTYLLVLVGLLQLAIMSFQLGGLEHMWYGLGFEIISLTALAIMFWFILKKEEEKKK